MKSSFIYLMLVFFAFLSARCQSEKSSTKHLDVQDHIFKDWLIDTLRVLKKNPDRLEGSLKKTEFVVAADSTSFDIVKTYSFNSMEKVDMEEISNVLSLLKEYDELPNISYSLSFITQQSFYPSIVANLKYDFISEIKKIKIVTEDANIEYKYIRGRLSGKKVEMKKDVPKKKTIFYDFDWKDNKLVKRKIE